MLHLQADSVLAVYIVIKSKWQTFARCANINSCPSSMLSRCMLGWTCFHDTVYDKANIETNEICGLFCCRRIISVSLQVAWPHEHGHAKSTPAPFLSLRVLSLSLLRVLFFFPLRLQEMWWKINQSRTVQFIWKWEQKIEQRAIVSDFYTHLPNGHTHTSTHPAMD